MTKLSRIVRIIGSSLVIYYLIEVASAVIQLTPDTPIYQYPSLIIMLLFQTCILVDAIKND